MRHINGAYTTSFNVTRKRAGHLFQGRYKAILVEADGLCFGTFPLYASQSCESGMVAKPE
jgi:hypothetical protein